MIPTEDMLHFGWTAGEKAASLPVDVNLHPMTYDAAAIIEAFEENYGYDILNTFLVKDFTVYAMAFGSARLQKVEEETRAEMGYAVPLPNDDQIIVLSLGDLLAIKRGDPQFAMDSRIIEREVGMWAVHELTHAIGNITRAENSPEAIVWHQLSTELNRAIEEGDIRKVRSLEMKEKIAYHTMPEEVEAYEAQRIADIIYRFRTIPPRDRKKERNRLSKWVNRLAVAYRNQTIFDDYFQGVDSIWMKYPKIWQPFVENLKNIIKNLPY